MPPFTRRAIVDAFLTIAGKKTFEKITVRDIVDACGVNRNTFYYYFQDIFGVLEDLFGGTSPFFFAENSLSAGFSELLMFTVGHRRAMQNIFVSIGSDGISKYLSASIEEAALPHIRRKDVPEYLQKTYLSSIVYITVGMYTDFLRGNCRADIDSLSEVYRELISDLYGIDEA